MDSITIKVDGADEAIRKLKAAGVKPQEVLLAAVEAGAKIIQAAALKNAPGPGIEYRLKKLGEDNAEATVGPTAEKFYYRYFETGTRPHRIAPVSKQALTSGSGIFSAGHTISGVQKRPFLRPAVDEQGDNAKNKMGEVIKAALDAV